MAFVSALRYSGSSTLGSRIMAQNPTIEAFDKILIADLQRAIDFVKYAEAKNGALLTFCSAWILALIGISARDGLTIEVATAPSMIAIVALIVAGASAIGSFWPRSELPWFLGGKRAGPHPPNLLYFGDIAKQTISQFESEVRSRYLSGNNDAPIADAYIHDLIVQIGVNSHIASRKLKYFKSGVCLVALAGILPLLFLVAEKIVKWWFLRGA